MNFRGLFPCLAILLLTNACKEPPEAWQLCDGSSKATSETPDSLILSVVNGEKGSPDGYEAVACVGSQTKGNGSTTPCATGTLITSRLVLTAQHLSFPTWKETPQIPVKFGVEARENPTYEAVANDCYEFRNTGLARCCNHLRPPRESDPEDYVTRYERYLTRCEAPLGPGEYLLSDAAIWTLEQEIPQETVRPIPVLTALDEEMQSHEHWENRVGTLVGYGSTDDCYSPQTPSGVRMKGAVLVKGKSTTHRYDGGGEVVSSSHYFYGEFFKDGPYSAPGDSGGPVLIPLHAPQANEDGELSCVPYSDLRVLGTVFRGCNFSFSATFTPEMADLIETALQTL